MNMQKQRGLSALAITAIFTILSFQNCSKVAFQEEQPVIAESITAASETPVLCADGQPDGAVRWDLVANQNVELRATCANGGDLFNLFEKYQKSVCENGKYVGTSDIKAGNPLGQRGACNCSGGINHGMTTWQVVPGQTIPDTMNCPANGMLNLSYEKEQQYTCNNGTLIATNNIRKGNLLSQSGACKCADGAAEGSSTYKLVPNATWPETGVCPYGGNLQYTYEKKQKYTCISSQSVAQNDFIKGNLLSTTGACNCEGGIADGGSKYVDLSGQTNSVPVTCKYGGNLMNVYVKQEKQVCSKGTFNNTGQYQNGAFIKQTGACNPPPVLNEEIPISVSKAEKPLDMVWVIDNSSSMGDEAAQVRSNLGSFIKTLDTGADMKFLLVSLKGNNGTNVSLPTGLDATRFFQANVSVSSSGGPKRMLEQLQAYKEAGKPFFRNFSRKIIVFVTDSDSSLDNRTILSELSSYGASTPDLSIFSFIGLGPMTSGCKYGDSGTYKTLATNTKGKIFDICQTDWTPHFTSLKTDILTSVSRTFTVKTASPTAKVKKVEVDGVEISSALYTFANGILTLAADVKVTDSTIVKIYFTQE